MGCVGMVRCRWDEGVNVWELEARAGSSRHRRAWKAKAREQPSQPCPSGWLAYRGVSLRWSHPLFSPVNGVRASPPPVDGSWAPIQ